MKHSRFYLILITLVLSHSSVTFAGHKMRMKPPFTNLFYLATNGRALLNDGKIISGRFYYSSPFLSKTDVFYFYSEDVKTKEIIPITSIKEIKFGAGNDFVFVYFLQNGCLMRMLQNGGKEKLNTRTLRKLHKTLDQKSNE